MAVGVDVVAVEEVRAAIRTFGDRYLSRIFTEHELDSALGDESSRAQHLAARFAAKEALFKLLGANEELPPWRSIEVLREGSGRAGLRLTGRAAALARAAGLGAFGVSLTHELPLAAAVVVAMAGEDGGQS